MDRKRVLFICVHNSARSQMAEAFLNHLGASRFEAESAGLEPGQLNPLVVEVMKEEGIDISHHQTKSVQEFIDKGRRYDYVVTVCDEASAEQCPVFPGQGQRLHFGFEDPSRFEGTHEEKLLKTKKVRDAIKVKIKQFIDEIS